MKHSNADARPRIHIDADAHGQNCRWRIGWHGREKFCQSPGQALDAALEAIEHKDSVIIFTVIGREG